VARPRVRPAAGAASVGEGKLSLALGPRMSRLARFELCSPWIPPPGQDASVLLRLPGRPSISTAAMEPLELQIDGMASPSKSTSRGAVQRQKVCSTSGSNRCKSRPRWREQQLQPQPPSPAPSLLLQFCNCRSLHCQQGVRQNAKLPDA
jgi:hypothetical protein